MHVDHLSHWAIAAAKMHRYQRLARHLATLHGAAAIPHCPKHRRATTLTTNMLSKTGMSSIQVLTSCAPNSKNKSMAAHRIAALCSNLLCNNLHGHAGKAPSARFQKQTQVQRCTLHFHSRTPGSLGRAPGSQDCKQERGSWQQSAAKSIQKP